jgi:hypothetical protein
VIDMADGADVDVRLGAIELLLGHLAPLGVSLVLLSLSFSYPASPYTADTNFAAEPGPTWGI